MEELHPHPSYVRHQLSVSASQLSELIELGSLAFLQPIVISRVGIVVDGYARWELARRKSRETILCLEYDLTEEEALRWLIQRHRPSHGLSKFNRALLALDLEPSLQETARANQRWGGQNKGLSSLTEAQTLDVRSKVAADAGVSPGTLDKVRKVKSADLKIQEATRAEEISIHLASQWCRLSAHQQLKKLEEYRGRKGTCSTTRRPRICRTGPYAFIANAYSCLTGQLRGGVPRNGPDQQP